MKLLRAFIAAGSLLLAGACANRPGGGVPLATGADSLAYVIGMNVGLNLQRMDSTIRVEALCAGIRDVLQERTLLTMDEARTYYLGYMTYEKPERARAYEERFLEDIRRSNRSYARTRSGLTYTVETIGDEEFTPASLRDTVSVRYVVRTTDGRELYSSYERGDTLRSPLGDLPDGGRAAVFDGIFLDKNVHLFRRIFNGARNFYGAVVPHKALDLPRDHRYGIRRKFYAEALVKALYRFQKPHTRKLEQIVELDAFAQVALDDAL